jgi:hypothetical protein
MWRRIGTWLVAAVLLAPSLSAAQAIDPGVLYRVFLKDGRALPSYGEYAVVDGQIVFVLPVGDPARSVELQLISLPVASIDMGRTSRYAEGTRARRYAETRGPGDYSAISAAVSVALAEVEQEKDPKRRLQKAEEARANLMAWPNAHFGYRAAEIRELASLFDEVISDLRAAAGQARMSVSLMAGPAVATYDAPLPALTLHDSIQLAMAAAEASETGEQRSATLRAALSAAGDPDTADLREEISRRLVNELNAETAYARLTTDVTLKADAAMRRGDVQTVSGLVESLVERDQALGGLRPQQMRALHDRLNAMLEQTRAFRLQLDHWTFSAKSYVAYELHVRPITSSLDGLKPVLTFIEDMRGMAFARLDGANARLKALTDQIRRIEPPADLQTIHSTLVSAVFMASQATERRRQAVISSNLSAARDASAAASGAMMLFAQARADLLAQLALPRFK